MQIGNKIMDYSDVESKVIVKLESLHMLPCSLNSS